MVLSIFYVVVCHSPFLPALCYIHLCPSAAATWCRGYPLLARANLLLWERRCCRGAVLTYLQTRQNMICSVLLPSSL